jgi:hypothetical protein
MASFNNYADDGSLEGVSQPSVKVVEQCGDTDSPSVPHATVHDPDSSPHYASWISAQLTKSQLTKTGFQQLRVVFRTADLPLESGQPTNKGLSK